MRKQNDNRLIKDGRELDDLLKRNADRGEFIEKSNGYREFHIKDSQGRIYYREDQTFSEPMQHYINGVLKVFGFLVVAGGIVLYFMW